MGAGDENLCCAKAPEEPVPGGLLPKHSIFPHADRLLRGAIRFAGRIMNSIMSKRIHPYLRTVGYKLVYLLTLLYLSS